MFWVRYNHLIEFFEKAPHAFKDFENGYKTDNTLSHAYERIICYYMMQKGRIFDYNFQENTYSAAFKSFENKHIGGDIYVLCSGPTLELIPKVFFKDKITISVGLAYKYTDVTYAVHKEYTTPTDELYMLSHCQKIFASLYKAGNRTRGFILNNKLSYRSSHVVYFDHYENTLSEFNPIPLLENTDKLIVSWSTVTSAINLAIFMGARM